MYNFIDLFKVYFCFFSKPFLKLLQQNTRGPFILKVAPQLPGLLEPEQLTASLSQAFRP